LKLDYCNSLYSTSTHTNDISSSTRRFLWDYWRWTFRCFVSSCVCLKQHSVNEKRQRRFTDIHFKLFTIYM